MPTPQGTTPRTEIENQLRNNFSELQKQLADLKNEVALETDNTKKQEKNEQVQRLEVQLTRIKENYVDIIASLNSEKLESLREALENIKITIQNFRGEVADLQNEKFPTPTTYELLKDSETRSKLLYIITSNPDEFKNLPGDTPEAKLEYIFSKIRSSIVLFMKNKLGDSRNIEKVINNTIAPAFERSLMELLKNQRHKKNIGMLEGIDSISWDTFESLLSTVGEFAGGTKTKASFNKFSQWMNAIDYLSVHNGVLRSPEKSAVLSNPLKFKEYINNKKFKENGFSPYTLIEGNIFEISNEETFKLGISLTEKQSVLREIGNIQVVNSPKTTALISKMIDKPEQFLKSTEGLQKTANSLLDGVNSINSVTKLFGIDILGEISKPPEQRGLAFRIMDFVCKLIGITGGLEGIVKRWRLDRMNLNDKKNDNISEIFKQYKESAGENTNLTITDESSCKTALSNFEVNDLENASSTKGDYLRDSIVDNMDLSLISPAIVEQAIEQRELSGDREKYLKDEIVTVKGKQQQKTTIISTGFTLDDKKQLAQYHLRAMKEHLEAYDDNELKDFYTNVNSTEDIALCITASLYADKDDVIEGVKAKVFLPENYGSVHSDGTVEDNGTVENNGIDGGNEQEQPSGEVSQYKLSPGEYPFKDVPPYKGIAAYDLRNVRMTPVLDYSELTKKHEGTVTLSGLNITNQGYEYPANGTTGNKSNNPCDISHSSFDIGYSSSSTVADGQRLARYNRPIDGIASAMRLLKNNYSNKSITEIDVGGYQGYYKSNEPIGLSALRIKWITDQCNALGVGPHQMLDFNDPTTLKSFVAQVAVLETGTRIGQKLLDDAYNLAFA